MKTLEKIQTLDAMINRKEKDGYNLVFRVQENHQAIMFSPERHEFTVLDGTGWAIFPVLLRDDTLSWKESLYDANPIVSLFESTGILIVLNFYAGQLRFWLDRYGYKDSWENEQTLKHMIDIEDNVLVKLYPKGFMKPTNLLRAMTVQRKKNRSEED